MCIYVWILDDIQWSLLLWIDLKLDMLFQGFKWNFGSVADFWDALTDLILFRASALGKDSHFSQS